MDADCVDILVVEDNSDDVMIVRRHLTRIEGSYRVDIATTAAEGIAKAEAHTYDMAFLDHHLPDMDGEDLILHMRKAQPTLPLVMLTGRGDERLAVKVMKAGAWDYLRKNDLSRSLLARTVRTVRERARLEEEVRRAQAELKELAIRDGLTGLCNHRQFQALLQTEFARARRYEQPLACLMLDLDHFKRINDTRGHPCGDQVLRHVADVLRRVARAVDVIARYGGEEFILLLPNTDAAGGVRMGERICEAMAETPVEFDDQRVPITVSVGVAVDADRAVNVATDLIRRADGALYAAKRSGRNRVCLAGVDSGPPPDASTSEVAAAMARRSTLAALTAVADFVEGHQRGREGHGARVADWVLRFSNWLEQDGDVTDGLVVAARLSGIGRVAVSPSIWNQPGPLAESDWLKVRDHSALGEDVVGQAGAPEPVAEAIRHQRERWDGTGYPDGLKGRNIPLGARILGLVDAWCALIEDRPWRPAFTCAAARAILLEDAGRAFDPALVDEFSRLVEAEVAKA